MKKKFISIIMTAAVCVIAACSGFLDSQPDSILSDDAVFGDPKTVLSALANFYDRMHEQTEHIENKDIMRRIDDAARSDGSITNWTTFSDEESRNYDYGLIRNINQFLAGVKKTTVISDDEKKRYEGEARFLRAWTYFRICRSLGGAPIVGDEVFTYTSGMDIEPLQIARSSEEETWRYIIAECRAAAAMLPVDRQTNSARANYWCAKMLEARSALYAASIAKYNALMVYPSQTQKVDEATGKMVAGIDASKAAEFYGIALAAAKDVIDNSPYELQGKDIDYADVQGKQENFYQCVTVKANNREVIWARDFLVPNKRHGFTNNNIPASHKEDIDGAWLGVTLNLVEQYEMRDAPEAERGKPHRIEGANLSSPIFYDDVQEPFANRDPRLWGTVIWPYAKFKGKEVPLQAGILLKGSSGNLDSIVNGDTYRSINGPVESAGQFVNKTGFFIRKFLDEKTGASLRQQNSDVWSPRFRMSEAYLIAAEAAMETGAQDPLPFINAVRSRAGVMPLTAVTLDEIVHERRVEFAFEDHRWWDMRRWRRAHIAWNAVSWNSLNPTATNASYRQLFPYLVQEVGDSNYGKWFFEEKVCYIHPSPRDFQLRHYYCYIDNGWHNNNPKLTGNPFQDY